MLDIRQTQGFETDPESGGIKKSRDISDITAFLIYNYILEVRVNL